MSDGEYQEENVFDNLAAGSYTIVVKDNNGCERSETAEISQPSAALTATASASETMLCEGASATLSVAATGGTGNYSYHWSADNGNGGMPDDSTLTSFSVSPEQPSVYTVVVVDANGCRSVSATPVVTPLPIVAIASQSDVLCHGDSTGAITLTASGGTEPYQYVMDNGDAQTSGLFSGLAAGSHSVVVTDAQGCSAVRHIVIQQPSEPLTLRIESERQLCQGDTMSLEPSALSGGTGQYHYLWTSTGGPVTFVDNPDTASVRVALADTATLTLRVEDSNACVVEQSILLVVFHPSSSYF